MTGEARRNIIKKKGGLETVMKAENIVKLAYYIVIFAALMLLSAVSEHGETEMSKILVPRMHEVPRMIEALIAAMSAAVGGGAAACYIENKSSEGRP